MKARTPPDDPIDKADAQVLRQLDELRRQLKESAEEARQPTLSGVGDLLQGFPFSGMDDARALLLDQVRDGTCLVSTVGNIIECNRPFAHMLGRLRDEVVGTPLLGYLSPADRSTVQGLLSVDETPSRAEVTFVRTDGTEHRVVLAERPTALYGSRAICLVTRDLTQERTLQDIVTSDQLARIVFDQASDAIVVCDGKGKILRANRRAGELAGAVPDLSHIDEAFRFAPAEQSGAPVHVQAWLRRRDGTTYEVRVFTPEGLRLDMQLGAGPIHNAAGDFLGWVVTFADITERAANERESRRWAEREKSLNDELVEKNRELEQFATMASHDLQEPLRKINAFSELIQEVAPDLGDRGRDFLARMRQASRRMSLLIDDLLQYARASSRESDLEMVDADRMVRDVLAQLELQSEKSGVAVEVGPLPQLRCVRPLFNQLMANLIGNAIKYRSSESPRVKVSARAVDEGWEFTVEDNGIGFEQVHAERIFQIFERLHTRAQYLGTGIGLAICKRIVERHGGRIWAESSPGKGATFRFTIPG